MGARVLEDLLGRVIDARYELQSVLGSGAMGAVYRARHRELQRAVAVKVLHPDLGGHPANRRRFIREATSLARLDHPNCVHVTDSGATADGLEYLVMELLEGEELSTRVGVEQLWEPSAACDLLAQLLTGLEHAHTHGVIHRDLKPQNVFITEDPGGGEVVKILDFGIAKLLDADGLTQGGMVIGTPRYMSPEQAAGSPADERSDLYSIGVLAHELLAGEPPFNSDDLGTVMRMQILAPPPPLPDTVPWPLADWVARMLEKSGDLRPSSAWEARRGLINAAKASEALSTGHGPLRRQISRLGRRVVRWRACGRRAGIPG